MPREPFGNTSQESPLSLQKQNTCPCSRFGAPRKISEGSQKGAHSISPCYLGVCTCATRSPKHRGSPSLVAEPQGTVAEQELPFPTELKSFSASPGPCQDGNSWERLWVGEARRLLQRYGGSFPSWPGKRVTGR